MTLWLIYSNLINLFPSSDPLFSFFYLVLCPGGRIISPGHPTHWLSVGLASGSTGRIRGREENEPCVFVDPPLSLWCPAPWLHFWTTLLVSVTCPSPHSLSVSKFWQAPWPFRLMGTKRDHWSQLHRPSRFPYSLPIPLESGPLLNFPQVIQLECAVYFSLLPWWIK